MIRLGFTGTRQGLTDAQAIVFADFVQTMRPDEFHHGDCIGADAQAHKLVRIYSPTTKIVIHPPIDPKHRAWCIAEEYKDPKPYLDRNHDIVDVCTTLVATPATENEQLRSGTWATVRYARRNGSPEIVLIRPTTS